MELVDFFRILLTIVQNSKMMYVCVMISQSRPICRLSIVASFFSKHKSSGQIPSLKIRLRMMDVFFFSLSLSLFFWFFIFIFSFYIQDHRWSHLLNQIPQTLPKTNGHRLNATGKGYHCLLLASRRWNRHQVWYVGYIPRVRSRWLRIDRDWVVCK